MQSNYGNGGINQAPALVDDIKIVFGHICKTLKSAPPETDGAHELP